MHMSFKSFLQLQEKLIMFNNGANYGQIVIMAGGGGSGKSFVVQNFIDSSRFKTVNVDDWKEAFLKISQLQRKYPEIRNLNLKNPQDVAALHAFVKSKGIKKKVLDMLFGTARNKNVLPNILFDITGKDLSDITDLAQYALQAGYNPKDINVLYVLTQWKTAYRRNLSRERVLSAPIFLATHKGATQTLMKIIDGQLPRYINGRIDVILNNPEESEFYKGSSLIKDFTSINLKREGKPMKSEREIFFTVRQWLDNNAPNVR